MSEVSTRMHCPWCTTRLSAQAAVCHRCGAIKKRRPVSMMKLFFLHPLLATVVAAATFILTDLGPVKSAAVFLVIWAILSLIHIALRQRRFWVQIEPLLLQEEEAEEQITHKAPFAFKPGWVTAATVVVGIGVVWATAPRSAVEPVSTSNVPISQASAAPSAPAPMEVATVAPPREALPPTPPAQPWKAETTVAVYPDATKTVVEPAKVEAPAPDRTVVLAAQRLLSDLGYDVGGIDGVVGSRTRAAIKSFRDRSGLPSDEINANLIAALETAGAGQPSAASASSTSPSIPAPSMTTTASIRTDKPAARSDTNLASVPRPADPAPAAAPWRNSSVSTASLNREVVESRAQIAATPPVPSAPVPAPRPTPIPSAQVQVPVNGVMMPVPPRDAIPLPPRSTQQAEAPSNVVTPRPVPIHTMVPTIQVPNSGPVVVDPSQAPVRLGPPVRLQY